MDQGDEEAPPVATVPSTTAITAPNESGGFVDETLIFSPTNAAAPTTIPMNDDTDPAVPFVEETNNFRIEIPGKKVVNFIIGVGCGIVLFLFSYGCYFCAIDFVDFFSIHKEFPSAKIMIEFTILISLKMFFFVYFPLESFAGIILTLLLRDRPSTFNRIIRNCWFVFTSKQPVAYLYPSIYLLGYYLIKTLFQMVHSIALLANFTFEDHSWAYLGISTTKFFGAFTMLLWYYDLIQVAHGQYRIARVQNSINLRTPTTATPANQPQPQQPQLIPNQSINIENEHLTDSSDTVLITGDN